ncbi:MAG: carbohydrate ABC transporter permease [Clostridiales bacterium]|nr:carbohydrate ABC transporter permease [Clostridiales bacterium]
MAKKHKSVLQRNSWISWVIFSFLLVDTCAILFLYLWAFFTSLKTPFGFLQNQIWPEAPWKWTFENFKTSFTLFESYVLTDTGLYKIGLFTMLINTVTLCVLQIGVSMTSKFSMAYVLGRFKGRHVTFINNMFLFLMMIPFISSTASSLNLYKSIGVYDTWFFIIIMAIPFFDYNFLILQSFIRGIGAETIEAAKIDGAGNFRVMWQIVFPQVANVIAIMSLMTLIGSWNDYMTTVIWMPSYPTLAYGVYAFSTSTATGASLPPVQMAGAMILALPVVIVFIIFKEKILGGISFSLTK